MGKKLGTHIEVQRDGRETRCGKEKRELPFLRRKKTRRGGSKVRQQRPSRKKSAGVETRVGPTIALERIIKVGADGGGNLTVRRGCFRWGGKGIARCAST